jgi:hypothetical protein
MARISGQYGGQKLLDSNEFFRTKVIASAIFAVGVAAGLALVFIAGVPIIGLAVLAVTIASAGFGNLFLSYGEYARRWHASNDE